jgi:hypothetical protein
MYNAAVFPVIVEVLLSSSAHARMKLMLFQSVWNAKRVFLAARP